MSDVSQARPRPIAEFLSWSGEHYIIWDNNNNNNNNDNRESRITKKENDNGKILAADGVFERWSFGEQIRNFLLASSRRTDEYASQTGRLQALSYYLKLNNGQRIFVIYTNISGYVLYDVDRVKSFRMSSNPEEQTVELCVSYVSYEEEDDELVYSRNKRLSFQSAEQYEQFVDLFSELLEEFSNHE
jgi:hypothetical protein